MMATVVPFGGAFHGGGKASEQRLTDGALRARQTTVPFGECHAAFQTMSYEIRTNRRRIGLFHDLSAAFPKGRTIAVLGHEGSGKSTLLELLLKRVRPSRGRVVVNGRLSWPLTDASFLEPRLSLRQNVLFFAEILGLQRRALLGAVASYCELSAKQLGEPTRNLPPFLRRRAAFVMTLAADFDCLLLDNPYKPGHYGLSEEEGRIVEAVIFRHDTIGAYTRTRQIPQSCDLVYILYEGRLFMFEDVAEAVSVFDALPFPDPVGERRRRSEPDIDDDEDGRDEYV